MGIFSVPIEVGDPEGTRFERVDAMVDTGATFTIMPEPVLDGLGVEPNRSGRFELADGSFRVFRMGETLVQVEGEELWTFVVFGDAEMQPILGAHTMEALGLAVDMARQRLIRVPYRLL